MSASLGEFSAKRADAPRLAPARSPRHFAPGGGPWIVTLYVAVGMTGLRQAPENAGGVDRNRSNLRNSNSFCVRQEELDLCGGRSAMSVPTANEVKANPTRF
jgi:hypothetical protein